VDLLLARCVNAGQLLKGTRLIGGVVIDMQGWIAIEMLDQEVHYLLEGELLRLCVVRPEGMMLLPPLHHLSDAEEVLEAFLANERIAPHVEEKVGGRWRGHGLRA